MAKPRGRLLHFEDERRRLAVRAADREAQRRLRAEITEAVQRSRLPVEQTLAVLWVLLEEAGRTLTDQLVEERT